MNDGWRKIDDPQNAVPFWKAGSNGLLKREQCVCPACAKSPVRFYAHHFSQDRSAMWIWCSGCKSWTVASNMKLEASFADPFADLGLAEFEDLERSDWLDRLDGLWDDGSLPQQLA